MQKTVQDQDEQSLLLSDLLGLLWKRKIIIAECVVFAMLLMVIGLLVVQPKYRVTTTIIERQDETTGGMRNLANGLSSLSLGVLGGQLPLSNNFQQFLNLLTEPATLERLPERNTILHTIFKKEWDSEKNVWKENNGLVSLFNMLFGLPREPPPDAQRLSEFLKKRIVVAPIDSGPLYRIYIDWPDPAFATHLLSTLIRGADEILRTRYRKELEAREAFLTNKLKHTDDVEQRQALVQIFSQTILSQATLYQNPYYAVNIVQPPVASSIPVSPAPFLYLLFAAIGGSVIGCAVIFVTAIASGTPPRDYSRHPQEWLIISVMRSLRNSSSRTKSDN